MVPLLDAAPGLRPITIFEELGRRHGDLPFGSKRTLERRIRSWRAAHEPDREVMFGRFTSPAGLACRISRRWLTRTLPSPARC